MPSANASRRQPLRDPSVVTFNLDTPGPRTYLTEVKPRRKTKAPGKLVEQWQLASTATLGSSVRTRGILLEVRARLPLRARKLLDVEAGGLTLRVPDDSDEDYADISAIVSRTLENIDSLPVIPREVEDVLSISAAERHRWLKDGRLQSAGTRTVKLRGRARQITFHVFDPRHIEDVLDRDLATVWREEDALAAAENRRRAAGKAALTRARKSGLEPAAAGERMRDGAPKLQGWEEFDIDGLLR